MDEANRLAVDVISDVVCPWCFIGKRKLDAALRQLAERDSAMQAIVRWHPFELNPDLPADGIPRTDYLERKWGSVTRANQNYVRVSGVGEAVGIGFRFDLIERQPNTFDAHRLIAWAQRQGDANALVERLFAAYFLEGRFVGDRGELARIAGEAALSEDAARAMLDSDAVRDDVARESREALDVGVRGVPFYIFNGRIAVSGAQNPETLLEAIAAARAAATSPA
ncbi:MAG TPA: DsbA family oxidoreductase [Casimicrobiaceae bacterium]|jgi:predicted DsbA family dithiol-disulfide isomerase|nr:DsbA family oxidoreductase [Casimicrobiaceae bacterium]